MSAILVYGFFRRPHIRAWELQYDLASNRTYQSFNGEKTTPGRREYLGLLIGGGSDTMAGQLIMRGAIGAGRGLILWVVGWLAISLIASNIPSTRPQADVLLSNFLLVGRHAAQFLGQVCWYLADPAIGFLIMIIASVMTWMIGGALLAVGSYLVLSHVSK